MVKCTEELPQPSGRGRYPRRAQPGRRVVPVLISLPPLMVAELDQEATRRGLDSRSELVRMACRAMLEKPASA